VVNAWVAVLAGCQCRCNAKIAMQRFPPPRSSASNAAPRRGQSALVADLPTLLRRPFVQNAAQSSYLRDAMTQRPPARSRVQLRPRIFFRPSNDGS